MRRKIALIISSVAAIAVVAIVSCDGSVEDPGCDIFTGSATVYGTARDVDGRVMADADVEITFSEFGRCVAERNNVVGEGRTDADGHYEVLLQAGNTVGERCVFGWVARSDSVSAGRVSFTSDCRRTEPVEKVQLDLVATPAAMMPEDLVIGLYRLHGLGHGPHYTVAVEADGDVHFASTYVIANGVKKTVIHDHGCRGIGGLDSLTRLE